MSNTHESLLSGFADVSLETWKAEVERGLRGAPFDKLNSRTLEGIEIKPLYTAEDWPSAQDPAGFPAAPPHRRGGQALGRFGERWDARPRRDNPNAEELAAELAEDVECGARSLWLCFDSEVRFGRALSGEPPRKPGAPCESAEQLAAVLRHVPLDRLTLSLDAGGNALPVAACFATVARSRGLDFARLEAWLNCDPLAALARDGSLPGTLDEARAELCELSLWASARAPRWRSVTVSSVRYHDAGAHGAQEIGCALASAVTYLRWLTDAGMSIAEACRQLAFSFSVGSDFFMEIAKLRAFRQCWSSVVASCGGDAEAQRCTLHSTTSPRTKTLRDPYVNMLRETTEAFGAAVGGADVITTSGFDRVAGFSDALGRRIARNLQVILSEEAHVARVADPAGGAWYAEALTTQLAERGWQVFQAIERSGGMPSALASGAIAAQLDQTARAREELLAKRKQSITGVSEFADVNESPLRRPSSAGGGRAPEREQASTAAPNERELASAISTMRTSGDGRVTASIELAAKGVKLAQIGRALRSGEPLRMAPLPLRRNAEAYERLREACDARAKLTGRRPSAFLCNLGAIPAHKARAQFATSFFNAGGFAVVDNDGFATVDAATEAFIRSAAELAVVCGSDDAYPQWIEKLVPGLLARGAKRVVLAGRPGKEEVAFRKAGVTDFIFLGCNAIDTLSALLTALGVVP